MSKYQEMRTHHSHSQNATTEELYSISTQMASLLQTKNSGLWTDDINRKFEKLSSNKLKHLCQIKMQAD